MGNNKKKTLVLASGGIDSSACIKYYQDLGFEVRGVFVDYGQKARLKEWESAQKIAAFYKIKIESLIIKHPGRISSGEIRGRNGFLIMAAMLANPDFLGLISLGIHAGVPYYDCSKSFANKMSILVTEYSDGRLKLDFPFITWDKKMIFSYCKDMDVPIHLTYSCENGDDPCGSCQSCLDRSALNVI
jgi:7-cyano-7-deazaguanine synthase